MDQKKLNRKALVDTAILTLRLSTKMALTNIKESNENSKQKWVLKAAMSFQWKVARQIWMRLCLQLEVSQ